jgi:hypothetical protein
MSDAPQVPPRPPTANKRTPAQKAADMLFIERHALRGRTLRQIAELLEKERGGLYKISHAQVSQDLKKLKALWLDDAKEMVGHEKQRELRKLDVLEVEAWDAWDRSKQTVTRTTLSKKQQAAAKNETGTGGGATETKSAVQVSQVGNPAFLDKILAVSDRRAALLGLNAPVKNEHSGPEGSPIPIANVALSDEDQDALLRRHYERMIEEEAEVKAKAANANNDEAKPSSTPPPT